MSKSNKIRNVDQGMPSASRFGRSIVLPALLGILFVANAGAQSVQNPIPWLIAETKKSVLPVLVWPSVNNLDPPYLGTCVLVGKEPIILALTCEHILAIKDTAGNTIRYADRIAVLANRIDGSTTMIPAEIVHADAKRDFGLLALNLESIEKSLSVKYIQPSRWQQSDSLHEGETIIYIGYPMGIGVPATVGSTNHPLSRTGIVSQVVPGHHYFLIDGFVQHGHSGSPVFVLFELGRNIPPRWDTYLVGIARGFPQEYTDVLQEVRLERAEGKKVLLNPGFTYVTAMDEIISVLDSLYGIRP